MIRTNNNMQNCKDCNYSDEFCASGDCPNDTSLTEQYKNSELETGKEYWVRLTDEWKNSIERVYFNGDSFECFDVDDIEEVLAPVPSYEEWKAKNEENKNLYKMLDVLNGHLNSLLKEDKENQQLKELLLVCRKILEKETYDLMVKKIDEVLK